MYGRKRYPSMVWLLVQASIVFCYTSPAFCKPYRQKIHQEENTNNLENNKTIIQATNNPAEHSVHIDKDILDPSFNSPAQLSDSNKDKLKTNVRAPLLHESVIFKAVVSNINVVTLQEKNSTNNGQLPKHFPETGKQEHQDANDSHNSDHRESKAHLKWDGHVVAAPLKYDPQVSNFQTPRRVSDTVSTSKMVLSLLTAAAALGSICLTVAIFQCCCRRKRSSSDEDEDQIIDDQRSKEKATVKPVDTHEQAVEPESSEKDVHIPQTDTPVETPTGQTTINGETVQQASEKKEEEEEEQVSVKDKIKAFETQALKPLSPENVEHHRTLIKRPHSRAITDGESESLSSSTTLIMGQVFRKRADTEKCQRKETVSTSQKVKKDDDYFGVIGRETEVLKSYRRAPAPRNRNKATKALYRKTMPNMDSTERSDMEISMSDWESTVHSFHQVESPFGKQDSKKKKKTPIPLPLPNQNAKDEVDNKLEDSTDGVEKTETKTEETTMETVSESDTQNLKSAESTENNTPDMTSSSGDEASQGEETKIKEEMKEDETNKDGKEEVELEKEGMEKKEEEKKKEEKKEGEEKKKEEKKEEEEKNEEKEKRIKEEEERLIKEKKEKEKQKKEAEEKEKLKKEAEEKEKLKKEAEEKEEKKLKEDEKMKEGKKAKREAEKAKEEELKKEKTNKDKEQEKREKEKESEVKREKEKQLKKEKELKREKDEIKREKEELNKEELKKGKEQLEKEGGKAENIFFQIDPTAEPTAAKLVKRDSGHESNETSVQLRESKDDLPKNDESPKSKRHLAHLDRTTMFMLPGQKPEDHMSLMLSLKEKLNDKKEKNELDADTDTKMDVDPEPETEKLEAPEC